MSKLTLGLFFGGKSPEHEISVITANQILNNLDKNKYNVIPIYVSKKGDFYANPKFVDIKNFKDIDYLLLSSTKIDLVKNRNRVGILKEGFFRSFTPINIAFPAFHGAYGEDGCIQGLFEFLGIPYVGFNVAGSAIGMDKIFSKYVFRSLNLPTIDYVGIKRIDWLSNSQKTIEQITKTLKFPMFIKPANLGSSIGVNKVLDKDSLEFAIEVAFTYSEKVIIEKAVEDIKEINCSVLGYKNPIASVCEMPIPKGDILSFADKYKSGGTKGSKNFGIASLSRIVPAPINKNLSDKIRDASIKIFKAMDGCGVARIDFFADEKNNIYYVNEVNTIPGSLSYYLWEKSEIKFKELLDKVIEYGFEREKEKGKIQYIFDSNILSEITKDDLKR